MEKEYLFLDEPFVHLDNSLRQKVIEYLLKLKEARGLGVLIVSHNAEEILTCCDEIIYLKDGSLKRKTTPEKFYNQPKSIQEAELFGIINAIKIDGEKGGSSVLINTT